MAKANEQSTEALVKTAEAEGLPRPVAEDVVEEAKADVKPDKLGEAVKEAAAIEKEDRDLVTGKGK